ncbi:epoxide hydrolase family protein [Halocatena halophila]|uniref:epoxide hydrolase family protein n=1 Tax=Halocatena halophila TaxID=2814576 RepID=UPI002ED368C4
MTVTPFDVHVPQETLDDMQARLANTRWPDEISGAEWEYGTNLSYMKELIEYWQNDFDWREQEKSINQFDHYRAEVDGFGIHFIHEHGSGDNPTPLLLTHGWPSSFIQMLDIIPLLTNPETDINEEASSFDVVVPSLPGYGFSDRPTERGMSASRIADLFSTLMADELGYDRYALRGSDLGASVSQQLGLSNPESVIGIHLAGTSPYLGEEPENLTETEQEHVEDNQRWLEQEGAYALEHATKPQTLAYGLNDSPAGLAAWIVEKFRAWSDCGGDIETAFTKDEMLTNLTIYWTTETINSSIRLYYESLHDPGNQGRVEVPTGILMAQNDILPNPREWSERFYQVERWTETSQGGHFLEWEAPELVADDIHTFFRSLKR